MAAVIPAPAWWQRGAATLQPPAARGCSPKGVGLIVAEALMELSAVIRVELILKKVIMGGVLGDAWWAPLISTQTIFRLRATSVEGPVMDCYYHVVACMVRALRGVVLT